MGYMQAYGVDYDMTQSPVPLLSTLRMIKSLAVKLKLTIQKMDGNTAFLNAILADVIYVM